MESEIRTARPEDLPELLTLEQQCFGDGEADARLILQKFAGWQDIWVLVQENRIVSMALVLPVTLANRRGAYLYALATQRTARQTGQMTALLQAIKEKASEKGWSFLCLIPASEALADFYAKRGFAPAFERRRYAVPIRRNLLAMAEFDDVTLSVWTELRKRYGSVPCVQLSDTALAAVLTDYYTCGGSSVRTADGYGFFRRCGETLLFDELFAQNESAVHRLLQACREKTGCTQAVIFIGDEAMPWFGSGSYRLYGMVCPLDGRPVPVGYMGLMLENYSDFVR